LQCPFCRHFMLTGLPGIARDFVRTGRARFVFNGVAYLGPQSVPALEAVLAAGVQDRLWNFAELLYHNQGQENSGWVPEDLQRAALVAGTVGIVPRWALAGSSDPRLKELARSIQGSVISPGDSGYRAARILYNPRFDGIRPRAVVLAESSTDVAKAILWARK